MKKLVLASTSPYRKMLLERLQTPFIAAAPVADETPIVGEPADARALRLAEEKARSLAGKHGKALILGGDQTIADGDKIFDKPGTRARARAQLGAMRGRRLRFYTAVALYDAQAGACESRLVAHTAVFRKCAAAEVGRYLQKENALACAGGAQIEGLGIAFMESLEGGDPTALIGMPLMVVAELLRARGAKIP